MTTTNYNFHYSAPVVLVATTPDNTKSEEVLLSEPSLNITYGASVALMNLFDRHGFTRRGRQSWSLSANTNPIQVAAFFREYVAEFTPYTLIDSTSFNNTNDLSAFGPQFASYYHETPAQKALINSYAGTLNQLRYMEGFALPTFQNDYFAETLTEFLRYNAHNTDVLTTQAQEFTAVGFVSISMKDGVLWVRIANSKELNELSAIVEVPRIRNSDMAITRAARPSAVYKVLEALKLPASRVFDEQSSEAMGLIARAQDVVTAGYAVSAPASVVLYRGVNVETPKGLGRTKFGKLEAGEEITLPLTDVLKMQKKTDGKVEFIIHPSLHDVARMEKAEPFMGDPRLRDYQKVAVGMHLATEIGYLQTCSPGMGKTVMQLSGMRERAKTIANYRGLIITESNVRNQWFEEAETWFPEAKMVVIKTHADTQKVAEALAHEGPVIILSSYSHTLLAYEEEEQRQAFAAEVAVMPFKQRMAALMSRGEVELNIGSMMLDTRWNDISADEAVVIRNASSKSAKILWTLRGNSDIATALTATPINKSPDDLARLVSWVRNDRNMFTGSSLADLFDVETPQGAKKLAATFGPIIFRRDTSEISDELPDVSQTVHLLTPSASEKALATAAEEELKRCYFELIAALDEMEELDKNVDKEALAEVKAQLREANGAWIGGTQLARMATSDPSALLASESTGAALLQAQGLVAAAMQDEPTKRTRFIKEASERVARGEQIIVFTEFEVVARKLVEALNENGINAKAYTGKNSATRDIARKEFQAGELDVLVATQAGERGLTLHRASALYHYDLPWTLEKVIQRTGRGVRIGSKNKKFDIVFFVMEGTVEQRMAENLVNIGMSASLILDKSRGVDIKKTETGTAMSGLVGAMSKGSDNKNLRNFGKMLLGV